MNHENNNEIVRNAFNKAVEKQQKQIGDVIESGSNKLAEKLDSLDTENIGEIIALSSAQAATNAIKISNLISIQALTDVLDQLNLNDSEDR